MPNSKTALYKFLFLIPTFVSTSAYADYFSDVIAKYNQSVRFSDPDLATLAGGAKAYVENTLTPDLCIQTLYIGNSHFRDGSLPVAIYKYDGPVTQPAKLTVVLAGLFNNANDPLPLHVLRMMKALGNHILVIPNSFSTSYMNQGPQFAIADFVQEAQVVREITASVIQSQIGKQNVTEVEILGESYGAFLVPVVLAQDTSHIFGNNAIALSPPVNILQSMGRLDSMINATANQRASCVDSDFALVEAGEQAVAVTQAEISGAVARCAPAFLAYVVFQESLVQSAMRMNNNTFRQLSSNQVRALTFNSFFSVFEPGVLQSRSPQFMSFEPWLLLAEKNNPNLKMKIVSAQDDFLNSPSQWSAATFNDPTHVQLTALNWGGHLGYLTDPWFENAFYRLLY